MKPFCFLLVGLLLTATAQAAKKKKKSAPKVSDIPQHHEDSLFPACMVHQGVIDPQFFNGLSEIAKESGKQCRPDADPRWQAYLYLQNLRDFADHAGLEISNEANDFINAKQNDALIKLDAKSKLVVKKNSEKFVNKAYLKAVGMIPAVGSVLSEVVKYGFDGGLNAKLESVNPGETEVSSLNQELKKVAASRDELVTYYRDLKDNLTKLLTHIKAPEKNPIDVDQQKFLRSVICRFMPKMKFGPGSTAQDKRYDQFCSTEGGPGNFNRERGSLSCKETDALSIKNRNDEYRKIKAAYARSLAENIQIPDPHKIIEEGTPSRLEVMITEFRSEGKKITAGFISPGGIELLCSILRDPAYDKYFDTSKGGRRLRRISMENPLEKGPFLTLKELKLPVAVIHKSGNSKYPETSEYFFDSRGDLQKISINNHKSHNFTNGNARMVKKHTGEVKDLLVYRAVDSKCDD